MLGVVVGVVNLIGAESNVENVRRSACLELSSIKVASAYSCSVVRLEIPAISRSWPEA